MGLNERFAIYFEGVRDAVVSKWRVRPELTCSLVWGLLAVLGGFIVQLTLGSFYRYRKKPSLLFLFQIEMRRLLPFCPVALSGSGMCDI